MIKALIGFFLPSKADKLKRQKDRLYTVAMNYQRNGKLREYGQTMAEIEELEKAYVDAVKEETGER